MRAAASIATASLAVAGGLHLGVALDHGLDSSHGGVFVVLGLVQVSLAGLLSRRAARGSLLVAAVVSGGAIGLWVATRLPAGGGETIGALDVTAALLEAATLGAALVLLRGRAPSSTPVRSLNPIVLLAAVALTAMSADLAPSSHDDHHHGEGHAHTEEHVSVADAPSSGAPIFGDLFEDHHSIPGSAATPAPERHDDDDDHPHPEGDEHADG